VQPVRQRVIERDFLLHWFSPGRCNEVWHSASERRRDSEAAGVRVVLHIILRRGHKQYGGRNLSDNRGEPSQQAHLVNNLQIIANRRLKPRAQYLRRGLRFASTDGAGGSRPSGHAAAIAAGERHIMQLASTLAEQQKGSGHEEFNVVRMRRDGHGANRFRWRSPPARPRWSALGHHLPGMMIFWPVRKPSPAPGFAALSSFKLTPYLLASTARVSPGLTVC